jgi:hypothetical protein
LPDALVTKSLCLAPGSSRERDARSSIVIAVDVLAIAIGLVVFLLLLWMIEGVDRI